MGNEIIETEAKEILPDAGRAHLVHGEILAGKKQVAIGLYEFAAGLKAMRDERLYQALGCAGFDEYCEKLAKVNVSQAYKYIKVYEELGAGALQSAGGMGIEKLFLVTQLPPAERSDAIAEPETIEGMSVKELKDFVAKARQQGEQLSLIQGELDELKLEKQDAEAERDDEKAKLERELEHLREKLRVTEDTQKETIKAAINAEKNKYAEEAETLARLKMQLEIEEARKAGEADGKKAAEKTIDKAKQALEKEKKALEDAKKTAEDEKKKAEAELDALKKEIGGRDEQIAGLEKKLRTADSATAGFKVCLESLVGAYDRCRTYLEKIEDANERTKCETALGRAVERLGTR